MKKVEINLNSEQSAYIAGLIDGEGCLNFYKSKNRTCKRGYTFVARLQITNTNLEALIEIAEEFGIGRIRAKRPNKRNQRAAYDLFFSPREVRALLPSIIPYLRMKKKQAELLQAFLEKSHWGLNGQGKGLSDSQINDRENLFQQMRKLNERGVKPALG